MPGTELAAILAVLFSIITTVVGLWTRASVAELESKIMHMLPEEYVRREECDRIHKLMEDPK